MIILALEFSASRRSVALARTDASAPASILGELSEAATGRAHPMTLIERTLAQSGLGREEVECIAVGLGPGSYTGIRSAIAIAQGWHLARAVRLMGIGSFETLAAQAQALGWFGTVGFAIDAQRNEWYFAAYEISSTQRREVLPLRLMPVETVRQLALGKAHKASSADSGAQPQPEASRPHGGIDLPALSKLAGPEITKWIPDGMDLDPSAAKLAWLASQRSDSAEGETLEPIYLRPTTFVKAPPPRLIQE